MTEVRLGMTKAEFARRMGIQRQNVNALFKTNNLEIIARASKVLDVPLEKARDAGTGKFVTKDYAKSHPKTTVVEKVKVGPTKHRK